MFFLASTYIPSIAQISGYVYFDATRGCSPYERAMHGTPIAGVDIYGGLAIFGGGLPGSGWNTSNFVTGDNGYYSVGYGCKESKKPPLSFAEVFLPKLSGADDYTGACSVNGNNHDFWLTHPEENLFAMNDYLYFDDNRSYLLEYCNPGDAYIRMTSKFLKYGTKYRVTIWKATVMYGSIVGNPVYTETVENLQGLPSEIYLDDFMNKNENGYYHLRVEVGNCNGWKLVNPKSDAHIYNRNFGNLSLENLMVKRTGSSQPVPITNTSCSNPIDLGLFSGQYEFENVTGTATAIFMKATQYYASDCSWTGEHLIKGYTIHPFNTQSSTDGVLAYVANSIEKDPSSSITGNNFIVESLMNYKDYNYFIEVFTSNSCTQSLASFWVHPDSYKEETEGLGISDVTSIFVNNQLHFDFNFTEAEYVSIQVFSTLGQGIKSLATKKLLQKGSTVLDYNVSELQEGLYFYNITTPQGILKSGKFVKH